MNAPLILSLLVACALASVGPTDVCGRTHNIPYEGNAVHLTTPVSVVGDHGVLRVAGYTEDVDGVVVNKRDVPLSRWADYKSWHWVSATAADGSTVQASLGIFGSTSMYFSYSGVCHIRGYDARRGETFDFTPEGTGVALGYSAEINPDGSDSTYSNIKVRCSVKREEGSRVRVTLHVKRGFFLTQTAFHAEYVMSLKQYMATATPLAEDHSFWFVGKKAAGWEVAEGSMLRYLGSDQWSQINLAGATGSEDHCEGVWPSHHTNDALPASTWRWMTASSRMADGRILGLNLDDRTGDQRASNSNFVSLDGAVAKITAVVDFELNHGVSWKIKARDGTLDALFTIKSKFADVQNRLFVNTTQDGFYGTLAGTVRAPNGENLVFSINAFAEDFCAYSW